jgi:pescadillo protein
MEKIQTLTSALQNINEDDENSEDVSQDEDNNDVMKDAFTNQGFPAGSTEEASLQSLFSNLRIFLGREVPRYSLEFVIRAFGGVVAWPETSGSGSPYQESSPEITHHIVDRPIESLRMVKDRVYVQPQWAVDCINAGKLLSTDLYRPGASLPPHLSPFSADPESIGQALTISEEMFEDVAEGAEVENNTSVLDRVKQAETAEQLHELELEAEVTGIPYEDFVEAADSAERQVKSSYKKKRAIEKEESERVEMAKMMMSNKKRKLLERLERNKKNETEAQLKLQNRRNQLKQQAGQRKKA